VIFAVKIFEVEALVVLALEVAKFEVVPHSVVMVARVEFKVEIIAFAKVASDENKLVEEAVEVNELVSVALVKVELVANKFTKEPVVEPEASSPHSKSEVEALYKSLSVAELQVPRPAPENFEVVKIFIVEAEKVEEAELNEPAVTAPVAVTLFKLELPETV
jgi:hypothetical protein